MRVALIAPPWYSLPPNGYGGTELVVALLARTLRRRGVDVLAYGREGSEEGTIMLAPAAWSADLGEEHQQSREVAYVTRILADLAERPPVDVVHDNAGWLSLACMAFRSVCPIVHTVHGPVYEPQLVAYASLQDRVRLISISKSQRESAPQLPWLGCVYNAIDIDSLITVRREEKQHYLLSLARISPQKGQHIAIEVARRTGYRLILAGKVGEHREDRQYFHDVIRPQIDRERVVYRKSVAGREKAELIARADALLAPISWPEPFGLFMAEAMASGTPVLAFPEGAAPELVEDGVTGFLARDADGLADAVRRLDDIDLQRCSDVARQRFSADVMADGYLEMYAKALLN